MKAEYDFSKGKRGAVVPATGKTRISIYIDNAVLDEFRARAHAAGTGYQTMMNEALKRYLSRSETPITEARLREVLRQEVPEYLRALTPQAGAKKTKRRSSPPPAADNAPVSRSASRSAASAPSTIP